MKRTPLRRRKPLKRGISQLSRKSKLAPISKEKARWNKLYNQKKKEAHSFQYCAKCGMGDHKHRMEPHHHSGRIGHWIMEFAWLCRPDHALIHDEAKQARALGWLQNQFFGLPDDPQQPKPWVR